MKPQQVDDEGAGAGTGDRTGTETGTTEKMATRKCPFFWLAVAHVGSVHVIKLKWKISSYCGLN